MSTAVAEVPPRAAVPAPPPPGPKVLPRFAQGMRMLLTEHRMLERYRRRYGDVFAVDVWPFDPLVVVAEPAEVRRIFTGDPAVLHAGEGNGILGPLVGPHSVLLLDDGEHLRRRKLLLPPFHGERMRVYGDVMREIAAAEVDRWPAGEVFALLPSMQRITLRIILRTVFGMQEGARMDRLEGDLARLLGSSNAMMTPALQRDFGGRGPWARFKRLCDEVDAQLFDEIARRRATGAQGEDILSMLLTATPDATDAELRDDLVTLLVAGHETTATTMAWTLERLMRHPEALARSREDGAYLDAAVKEAQRVRPVITYVMRRLTAPFAVGGYTAPAGATLGTSVTLMHRRADLYPEPHAFRPERFLDGKPDTYGWVPFGGGVRRCLGAAFAQYEMRQVLGTVLERCDLRPDDPRPERHRRKMITFIPARGARAVMTPRA
ncbi:MAG: cytochrome P450 [Actinomycetota bacterium]|nr:cytochrome P450 [Actinomycetota bacterium]